MISKREQALKTVIDALANIESACKLRGLAGLLDLNRVLQHFLCRFLSELYGLKLIDLDTIQSNFPAIDLADANGHRCFQITSDKSGEKVQATLDKYVEKRLYEKYGPITILVIGERQREYKALRIPDAIRFNPDQDILGASELVRHIQTLATPVLERLAEVVRAEIVQLSEEALPVVANRRAGLISAESAEKRFEAELSSITDLPVPVIELPHWRATIRPARYAEELVSSRSECRKVVEMSTVRLRGWPFPCLSPHDNGRGQGSTWIASWCAFMGAVEYWRFYQSGQFIHYSAVREVTQTQWRDTLQPSAMSHLRDVRSVDWNSVPGFISIINLLYKVTEVFEFAARVAQAGVYEGAVSVRIEVHGIRGFVLATDMDRYWPRFCVANEDCLERTWTIPSNLLTADSSKYSLTAVAWFLESFGWMEPNMEVLQKDQEEFLRRTRQDVATDRTQ